jgi:hypothetical protein
MTIIPNRAQPAPQFLQISLTTAGLWGLGISESQAQPAQPLLQQLRIGYQKSAVNRS